MIKAKDIMSVDPVTISSDADISQAVKILLEKGINGIPVVDDERLVGIICQSDLISQQKSLSLPSVFTLLDGFIPLKSTKSIDKEMQKIAAIKVSDAMTIDPVTVGLETDIEKVAGLMVDKNFHTLPVVEKGNLVGIIGMADILKTIVPK
ncbi:CBS domain-containing protein [Thermodesulfobacteriota bacterium]